MPVRRTLLAATLALFIIPRSVLADSFGAVQERFLADLWEHRSDPSAIVALYRADDLQNTQDSVEPFEATLRKVLAAPDSDPEVQAHVAYKLALLYRDSGRYEEARALEDSLGFIGNWRVLGPFDDENKVGFDAVNPPEKGPAFDGTFEGKGHGVAWLPVPGPVDRGVVPLDQMLDPSEKVAGYALSFIRVEQDTPCVLRGSYNEAYKLWVDGDLVASRKLYNGRAFDQFADPCTLRRGWNTVLVKVCNQEGGWNFALRVTDGRGRALKRWTAVSDPAKVGEPMVKVLAKDGTARKGFAVSEPEERLEALAKTAPTAYNLAAYALYLNIERTFDRSDDKNLRALRKAAEAEGADPLMWLALGDAERDHNKMLADYAEALARDPKNPLALERMARYDLQRGLSFPALENLRKAREADPASPALRAMEDSLRLQYITDGLGAADLKQLYGNHPRCSAVVEPYMDALKVLGQMGELARVLEAYRQWNQSDQAPWYNRIADLISSGHSQEALKLQAEMDARFPLDRTTLYKHASYLLTLNRPKEAEGLVSQVLSWSPDWPEGRELYGDVLEAENRTPDALAQYQQALILRPQMESVKRKVAFLSPQEEGFEARYRVDAKDLPTDLGNFASAQAVVMMDNVAVKVEANGLSSRYVQRVVQVLNAAAAQQLQVWPIAFDPDRQEVRVLEASILKADGTKVHAESMVTDALSDPQYRLYYRNRNLILSFPSLSVGDRLWIEYKISDVGESNDYGQYFGDLIPFGGPTPTLVKQYTLILPESFPLHIKAKGVPSEPMVITMKGQKIYKWVVRDLDRLQQEPGMPGYTETGAYLHVSTFKDWDAMGAWYAKFITDQWEMSPEVKATVAELVKGCSTPEEKARAIHRWVVQQTHYVGLEFGVHGFRPYKVRQIFERRFGDCKDKAILMAAMMREAGLDACMVLVRTRDNGEIDPEPASLAIFNHAICYVPELNLFLDGTAEYSGLRELPFQDQGIWVLLVWPDGRTKRVMTPVDGADANTYKADYDISVPPEGTDAKAKATVTITGQECSWVRRRYQDRDKVLEKLQKDLSGRFPGTALTSADAGDVSDIDRPVHISYEGTLGQVAQADGKGRLSLPIWFGRLSLSNNYANLQTRVYPLELEYPWTQTYSVSYHLPEGAAASLPPPVDLSGPFGSVSRVARQMGQMVTVEVKVVLAVRRVEPSQYEAFRDFCRQADQVAEERLRVRLSGGQP